MTSTQQQTKGSITLKGSADLVKEYLDYGINSVLYQRGIYPAETFTTAEHFGITIYKSTDEKIITFLKSVLEKIKEWLVNRFLQKISLIILNVNTSEVIEQWDFKIEYEGDENSNAAQNGKPSGTKDIKAIQKEIRDVLRQICATVSFLPLLDCRCSFDVLVTTTRECDVPQQWDETKPAKIANAQELQLRSFSTSFHKIDTLARFTEKIHYIASGVYDEGTDISLSLTKP